MHKIFLLSIVFSAVLAETNCNNVCPSGNWYSFNLDCYCDSQNALIKSCLQSKPNPQPLDVQACIQSTRAQKSGTGTTSSGGSPSTGSTQKPTGQEGQPPTGQPGQTQTSQQGQQQASPAPVSTLIDTGAAPTSAPTTSAGASTVAATSNAITYSALDGLVAAALFLL